SYLWNGVLGIDYKAWPSGGWFALTLTLRESLHSLWRMHWDLEPERAQRRAGFQPARRARQRERFRSVGVADGGRQDACPTLRFMESLHLPSHTHWDHELVRPRSRRPPRPR